MREVRIIPSKSAAHRAYICAALVEITVGLPAGGCKVVCGETSADIEATKACLAELISHAGDSGEPEPAVMRCGESGSTLRFLIPVCAALGIGSKFFPEGRLPERPLSPLREELERHGAVISPQGSVPLEVSGKLTSGEFRLPGNVSSQYISGLLFALPLLEEGGSVTVEGTLESSGYIDLTISVLRDFGIEVVRTESPGETAFTVPGGQTFAAPAEYFVEGDWSNAAFWLAAGVLGTEAIRITGLDPDSVQGDKTVVDILKRFGADIGFEDGCPVARPSRGKLKGIRIDASQMPDMVPVLALVGAAAEGTTEIYNAGRLRIKESDRLKAVTTVLSGLGADIEELPEGLIIRGRSGLAGGHADSFGDHRIAMMTGISSLISKNKVTLTGSGAVSKSYPGFFSEMERLGLAGNLELE